MKIIEIVNKTLEEFPETRDNDKMLCYRVYEKIAKENGEKIFIPFNLFKKFPAFETISRLRRRLNESKEINEVRKGKILTKSMRINEHPNSWMTP
jgi:transposase